VAHAKSLQCSDGLQERHVRPEKPATVIPKSILSEQQENGRRLGYRLTDAGAPRKWSLERMSVPIAMYGLCTGINGPRSVLADLPAGHSRPSSMVVCGGLPVQTRQTAGVSAVNKHLLRPFLTK